MLVRTLLAVSAAALATAAQAEVRNFPASGFDRVESAGPWEVSIVTGKAASVRAEGASDDLDRMEIEVHGGRLEIGSKRHLGWKWSRTGKVHVTVTMPSLRGISLAGSGDVSVDRTSAKAFSASIAGSGDLRIGSLAADSASFDIAGSGGITASGKCGSTSVSIAGSGNVSIPQLLCKSLKADIAGSGDIAAHASDTAKVSIVGSGDVIVAGGAKCSVSKMGSGSARCTG